MLGTPGTGEWSANTVLGEHGSGGEPTPQSLSLSSGPSGSESFWSVCLTSRDGQSPFQGVRIWGNLWADHKHPTTPQGQPLWTLAADDF